MNKLKLASKMSKVFCLNEMGAIPFAYNLENLNHDHPHHSSSSTSSLSSSSHHQTHPHSHPHHQHQPSHLKNYKLIYLIPKEELEPEYNYFEVEMNKNKNKLSSPSTHSTSSSSSAAAATSSSSTSSSSRNHNHHPHHHHVFTSSGVFVPGAKLSNQTTSSSSRLLQSPFLHASQKLDQIRTFKQSSHAKTNIFNVQDEKDFQARVLNSKRPVIVDFHATWCGPCKILGPRLEKILSADGRVDFAKVDIDKLGDIAMDYDVTSVPTVMSFKNGKPISKFIGVKEDDLIKSFIKEAVDK